MSDRLRYSRRRESELWRTVDAAITNFRIYVLRGNLVGYGASRQEEIVYEELNGLADKVAAAYRICMSQQKELP